MNVYFKEQNSYVDVPDDMTEDELRDVSENFTDYFDDEEAQRQKETAAQEQRFGTIGPPGPGPSLGTRAKAAATGDFDVALTPPAFYSRNVEPILQEFGIVVSCPAAGKYGRGG